MLDTVRAPRVGKQLMIVAVALTLSATSAPRIPGVLMVTATVSPAETSTRHWTVALNEPARRAIGRLSIVVTVSAPCGSGLVSVRPDDRTLPSGTVTLPGAMDGAVCDAIDLDASTAVPNDDGGALAAADAGDDQDAGSEPVVPMARTVSATFDLGTCPARGACSRGFTLVTQANDSANPLSVTIDVTAVARSEHGGCGCLGATQGIPFPMDATVTLVPDA